jgi:Transposase DDE domain
VQPQAGHALRKALGVVARQQGRGLAAVAELAAEAGAPVLGGSSLKAALDCDWDDPTARQHALVVVVDALDAVESFLAGVEVAAAGAPAQAAAALAVARQVCQQDVHRGEDGTPSIRQGVAKDRRISVEDAAMRHGRKTKSVRVDGYKRHVLRDLNSGLVCAVGVTPANVPEASVTDQLAADLAAQHARLAELHIDRAYLASTLVRDRDQDLQVFCKTFPVRNGPRFTKTAFGLDFDRGELTCPAGVAMPLRWAARCSSPPRFAPAARCASSAPPAPEGAACRSTPMSGCWSSCALGSSPPRAERSSASGSRSSTPWPMSAAGRAAAPATWGSGRTCSTFAAAQWSTTCTSSPVRPGRTSRPPEHR